MCAHNEIIAGKLSNVVSNNPKILVLEVPFSSLFLRCLFRRCGAVLVRFDMIIQCQIQTKPVLNSCHQIPLFHDSSLIFLTLDKYICSPTSSKTKATNIYYVVLKVLNSDKLSNCRNPAFSVILINLIGSAHDIGVAPIMQLRTCVIKIVTFKGGHPLW